MGLEWYPKTQEEIEEYLRIRREWRKYTKERNCAAENGEGEPEPDDVPPEEEPGFLKVLGAFLKLFFWTWVIMSLGRLVMYLISLF